MQIKAKLGKETTLLVVVRLSSPRQRMNYRLYQKLLKPIKLLKPNQNWFIVGITWMRGIINRAMHNHLAKTQSLLSFSAWGHAIKQKQDQIFLHHNFPVSCSMTTCLFSLISRRQEQNGYGSVLWDERGHFAERADNMSSDRLWIMLCVLQRKM